MNAIPYKTYYKTMYLPINKPMEIYLVLTMSQYQIKGLSSYDGK